MAEIRISLTGEDYRKLVAGEVTKISIANIIFAVGKEYMRDVDTIAISLSEIGFPVMKHYVEEAEKSREEKQT